MQAGPWSVAAPVWEGIVEETTLSGEACVSSPKLNGVTIVRPGSLFVTDRCRTWLVRSSAVKQI
jgi:hypothetical protein